MSRRGAVLFAALSVIWGLPYFAIRIAVRHGVDPGTLVFLRTAPAAAVLVPVAWRTGALRALRGRRRYVALYAAVHFGVPWLLMSAAEEHLTSSVTGMLVATVPLVAMGVARVTHPEERFGSWRILGLLLGVLGVGLLVGFDLTGSSWPWLLVMGGVVCGYACGPVVVSLRLSGAPGIGVVATAVSLVALAYAPWGLTHLPSHVGFSVAGSLVLLAFVCTAGAFLVFFELVGEVGPSRTVVVTYLNTGVAVLLGVTVLNEPLTWGLLFGFPLVVVGSVLATRRPLSAARPPGALSPPRSSPRAARRAPPR